MTADSGTSLPLAGRRVADFTATVPGPLATRILAQLGAEVWKVERPGGDVARAAACFDFLNADKRSLELDLKDPDDLTVARRLVGESDIVLEGFRPGVMARLGLGYDDVRSGNPSVIYCSLSGFGQHGPLRDAPGHDLSYLALAGLLDRHRDRDGSLVGAPLPVPIADVTAGLLAVVGVLAALDRRRVDGMGCQVDLSLLDASLLLGAFDFAQFLSTGSPRPTPLGAEPAHYGVFETRDGRALALGIAGHEDHFWQEFCGAAGFQRWRLAGAEERLTRRDQLAQDLIELVRGRELAEWAELLADTAVPWAPVRGLDEVASDPHLGGRRIPGGPGSQVPLGGVGRSTSGSAPALGEGLAELSARWA